VHKAKRDSIGHLGGASVDVRADIPMPAAAGDSGRDSDLGKCRCRKPMAVPNHQLAMAVT
jgi:hypothetical protein